MKNKKTINRVLELIRPYTYLVVSILVLAAVTVAATLYSPILIGKGVDCGKRTGKFSRSETGTDPAGSRNCDFRGISVGDESSDQQNDVQDRG